jgi:hypothetical protein
MTRYYCCLKMSGIFCVCLASALSLDVNHGHILISYITVLFFRSDLLVGGCSYCRIASVEWMADIFLYDSNIKQMKQLISRLRYLPLFIPVFSIPSSVS